MDISDDYLAGALDASARVAYEFTATEQTRIGYTASPELVIYAGTDVEYLGLWDEYLSEHGYRHRLRPQNSRPTEISIYRDRDLRQFRETFERQVVQLLRPLQIISQLSFSANGALRDEESFLRLLKTVETEEPYLRDNDRRSITFDSISAEFDVFGGIEPFEVDVPEPRNSLTDDYLAGYLDRVLRLQIHIGQAPGELGYQAAPVIMLKKGRIHPLTIDMLTAALDQREIPYSDQSELYYLDIQMYGHDTCQTFLDRFHDQLWFMFERLGLFAEYLLPYFVDGAPTDEETFYEMVCAREEVLEFRNRTRKYTPAYFRDEFDLDETDV